MDESSVVVDESNDDTREVGYKCRYESNYLDESDRAWNRLENPVFFRMGYYN